MFYRYMHPCALSHADFPAQVYLTVRYEWKADCTPEKSDVWWWWLGIFLFWVGEGGSDSDKKNVETSKFSQEGIGEKALYQRG